MAFFRRGKNANYNVLNGFSWHVPGLGGLTAMIGWLLLGVLLSYSAAAVIIPFLPGLGQEYLQLIIYPIMFFPVLIASGFVSGQNMYFENGYKVDNKINGKISVWPASLLCVLVTFALAFIMDGVNSFLPPMPESWQKAMEAMIHGNFIVCFVSVCVLAPVLEEWLLRGILLRGLLNCKRFDGSRGYSPAVSILITAAIFGIIHMNPWQAIPAFALGCIFGYVYYKTGSLKLTILMHFANNALSLIAGQFISPDVNSWFEIIPATMYYAIAAACLAIVILVVLRFRRIPTTRGSTFELIPAEATEASPLP